MLNVVYKRKQINFDVTYSGKVCQSWDRKYPHEHDFFQDYFATYVFLYDILGKEDTKNPQMNYGDNETIDFYCDNGKTVPHHAKCNGRFECKDLTDENGCQRNFTGHQLLPPFNESENISSYNFIGMFFVCTTNEWINIIAVCDTVTDCFDSSDEKNCADLSDTVYLHA
ncbi:low-density lipoprotein receptor class A domain-containing protein 3-like [Mercenaria mercenaria]|uniref:low-density lipoprotein receptor class A domain-containing protein 3-like n=1 Tax=Mercenaria mercenaria TaxID=6596 RepID=UPI00234F6D9C|nr:low-density lipoprotein receptor class A domain-containing protein 3-like [Mercenaria mercenaria]